MRGAVSNGWTGCHLRSRGWTGWRAITVRALPSCAPELVACVLLYQSYTYCPECLSLLYTTVSTGTTLMGNQPRQLSSTARTVNQTLVTAGMSLKIFLPDLSHRRVRTQRNGTQMVTGEAEQASKLRLAVRHLRICLKCVCFLGKANILLISVKVSMHTDFASNA